jgi:hypothetical protein
MILSTDFNNRIIGFQRNPVSNKHRGFVCEEDTISEAITSVVEMVAINCTLTREHPADILEKVEIA